MILIMSPTSRLVSHVPCLLTPLSVLASVMIAHQHVDDEHDDRVDEEDELHDEDVDDVHLSSHPSLLMPPDISLCAHQDEVKNYKRIIVICSTSQVFPPQQ